MLAFLLLGLLVVVFGVGVVFGILFERWYAKQTPKIGAPQPRRRSDIADIRRDVQEATEALRPPK